MPNDIEEQVARLVHKAMYGSDVMWRESLEVSKHICEALSLQERERAARIVEQAGRDYAGLEAATACEEAAATIRYAVDAE